MAGRVAPGRLPDQWLLFAGIGILAPIAYILMRRAVRRRYFARRNRRTLELRQRWPDILSGRAPAESWRFVPLDCEIVETSVLDQLDVGCPEQTAKLTAFLRRSGLLDARIWEARHLRGWRRQNALVSLGRMHAAESTPALADNEPGPVILQGPVSGVVSEGQHAQFSVQAAGAGALSYQWSHHLSPLLGATNATLMLSNVSATQAGPYTVRISDTRGHTWSASVTLTKKFNDMGFDCSVRKRP